MTGKVLFNATKQSEDREPGLAKMVGSIKSWVAKKSNTGKPRNPNPEAWVRSIKFEDL